MYNRLKEHSGESYIAQKYATNDKYQGFRLQDVEPGQILRRQGSPSFEVNLLLYGVAQSKSVASNGKEGTTGLYFPSSLAGGDFTQNVGLSIDTVEILAPGQVVSIYRPEVEKLYSDPLAMAELANAASRDTYNLRRLLMVRNQDALVDTLGHLMYLLTRDGQTESPRLSQFQIAGMINFQRSRVSTALGELIDSNLINRANGVNKGSYRITGVGKEYFSSEVAD